MKEKIRWGILSTGNIAHAFAEDLALLPDAELVAVGSRSQASADAFGEKFNIPKRHATYAALTEDPQVDVIYIATPHAFHKENCLRCLEAGKAVLCEKPFTINAAEAKAVFDFARRKNLFVMEAMWTRFLPAIVRLRELLADEIIGEIHHFTGSLGFRAKFPPEHRIFNPRLGGGVLLDVGVYPLAMAAMILGAPQRISALAQFGPTGVDEQTSMILEYDSGAVATIATSVRVALPSEAVISGTTGSIKIHAPVFCPAKLTLQPDGKSAEIIDLPPRGRGYHYQATAVMNALRDGQQEHPVMPWAESVRIMEAMDEIRRQIGFRYPFE